ncbi:EpsG family protein [Zobellia roscoffensis]|uniref:EpsG family protein n=1 Tax=Zobellia roscoffensis TaxID=2779508 RepID=UPI00188BD1FA|nr:EpsG family protein [Zobellia roscoffensis]
MLRFVILIGLIIFSVYPLMGILTFILVKLVHNKKDSLTDTLLFGLITLYACLVQSTRIWKPGQPSDWYNEAYWGLFEQVGTTPFFSYVFGFKEPVWNFINYIGYYITSGDYAVFIKGIAIITIFLSCYSIFLFWRKTNTNPVTLVASLSLIVFFLEYIGNLNNITRQSFALSIVLYALTIKITKQKTLWSLLISACFIHTFSFLYLILFLIKPLHNKLIGSNLKYFLYALAGVGVGVAMLPFIGKLLSGIGFFAYGFKRLEQNSTGALDDTVFNLGPLYITAAVLIAICSYMIWTTRMKVFNFYTNVLLVLMVVCVLLANTSEGLVSRLYISRMYLLPFVLPYVLLDKKDIHSLFVGAMVFFFGIRFVIGFDGLRGGSFFPPIQSLFGYSIFDFIF